jgi:acid stress chaperone HdeB
VYSSGAVSALPMRDPFLPAHLEMLMKICLRFALLLALALPFSAFARGGEDRVDVRDLTCEDLMEQDEETIGIMLMWLDGYLSGVTGDTSFSIDNLNAFGESIGAACAKSPEAKILDTAKIIGIR